METHRTIFALNITYVDATTMEMVEDALEAYLAKAPQGTRLPIDFGAVKAVTSGIGVLARALQPESQHLLACMRVTPRVREIFAMIGWADREEFAFVAEGACPACGGRFDPESLRCASCGPFAVHPVVPPQGR